MRRETLKNEKTFFLRYVYDFLSVRTRKVVLTTFIPLCPNFVNILLNFAI